LAVYDVATFTLNPAVDHWSEAVEVAPVRKTRTVEERFDPGGGGINVARVVQELGGEAFALYAAGGFVGDALARLIDQLDVDHRNVPIAGTTRISHTVFDRKHRQEYRFVPAGPRMEQSERDAFLHEVDGCEASFAVLSGSMPADAPPDLAAEVARRSSRSGARCVADVSGEALRAVVSEGVYLIKPNRRELEELTGRDLTSHAAQVAACREIVDAGGAQIVALTLGAAGAMLVTSAGVLKRSNPEVEVRSAVGAGDSFLAAMVLAMAQGRSTEDAFAYGVAAGAAAAMTPATDLCHRSDVERLFDRMDRENA